MDIIIIKKKKQSYAVKVNRKTKVIHVAGCCKIRGLVTHYDEYPEYELKQMDNDGDFKIVYCKTCEPQFGNS